MLKPHDQKCVCNFQIALLKCTKIVSAFKPRYTAGYLNKEVNEKKQIA